MGCSWRRINPGEPILKALKREVKEETGLIMEGVEKILAVQDILRVKGKHTVRITFLVKCKSGKIRLDSNEHKEYKWLTLGELSTLRYDKYLVPVVKQL